VPDFTNVSMSFSTPRVYRVRTIPELQAIKANPNAVPTPERQFSRTDRIYIRTDAYAPGGVTPPVTAAIAILAPGTGKRDVREVDLPARQLVSFERGRYRIRLGGLARKPSLGDRIPLTIVLRGDDGHVQEVPLDAEVRLHSPTEDEGRPHHKHAH